MYSSLLTTAESKRRETRGYADRACGAAPFALPPTYPVRVCRPRSETVRSSDLFCGKIVPDVHTEGYRLDLY